MEHLERHLPLVLDALGQVDGRHPALTDFAFDAVAAFEGCVEAGDGIGGDHAPKMRQSPVNREQIPLGMDPARTGLLLPEDVLAVVRRGEDDGLYLGGRGGPTSDRPTLV